MKPLAKAISPILGIILLTAAPALHAEDKEAPKEIGKAEKAQPKFIGLW